MKDGDEKARIICAKNASTPPEVVQKYQVEKRIEKLVHMNKEIGLPSNDKNERKNPGEGDRNEGR